MFNILRLLLPVAISAMLILVPKAPAQEGEGEGEDCTRESHTADQNDDGEIQLSELLRIIQFFNVGGFHCAETQTEDGFEPGTEGDKTCCPHASDYSQGADFEIVLSELLRLIQFFNTGGYYRCANDGTEDGYCPGQKPPPPNVVLFVCCTLRVDRIEGNRADTPIMPFVSAMAGEGALFNKAISPGSWTRPGCNALHTGIYPEVFSGTDEAVPQERYLIPPETITIHEWLAENGYQVWGYQTNFNAGPSYGFDQGFPPGHYVFNEFVNAETVTDDVLATIDMLEPPFYSMVQYIEAHEPYFPPASYETFFGPLPTINFTDVLALVPQNFEDFYFDLFESWRDMRPPNYVELSEGGEETVRYRYDASVRYMDDQIARIINAIDAVYPNTIYILTADHGEDLLERDIFGHGHTVHQELINVPFVMKGPGVPVGVVDRYVQTLDLLPTLARLLDLPPIEAWQGTDLFLDTTPRPVYSTTRGGTGATLMSADTVIDGGMKYILSNKEPGPELYDLENDPEELNNLAASEPGEVARLQALLEAHKMTVLP